MSDTYLSIFTYFRWYNFPPIPDNCYSPHLLKSLLLSLAENWNCAGILPHLTLLSWKIDGFLGSDWLICVEFIDLNFIGSLSRTSYYLPLLSCSAAAAEHWAWSGYFSPASACSLKKDCCSGRGHYFAARSCYYLSSLDCWWLSRSFTFVNLWYCCLYSWDTFSQLYCRR